MVPFSPVKDIPSLSGKVLLVTGGNNGLGKQSILELAQHSPSQIWLAARNLEKARDAASDIKRQVPTATIHLLQLDLASFQSIRTAARKFLESARRLDLVMLNAGIMATPPGLTKDGYEIQFGTNHVGHALLAKLLMPILLKTAGTPNADARIVVVASSAHTRAPDGGIQFNTLKGEGRSLSPWSRYGQSKLATILYTQELAKRYPQLTVVSVHPGIIETNLSDSWMESSLLLRITRPLLVAISRMVVFTSIEDGVKNQLWAAASRRVTSGEYYDPVGVIGKTSGYAKDKALAKELWDWTERELEDYEA